MSGRKLELAGLAALLVLQGACARAPAWPPAAAELRPGEEACAECRMFVSDPRFAAQRHSHEGTLEWFDDLGCLLERHVPLGIDPQGVFVRAFEGGSWLRGDVAIAVRSQEIASPMGYGWRAYATIEEARAVAAGDASAEVLPLAGLLRDGTAAIPAGSHLSDNDTPRRQ